MGNVSTDEARITTGHICKAFIIGHTVYNDAPLGALRKTDNLAEKCDLRVDTPVRGKACSLGVSKLLGTDDSPLPVGVLAVLDEIEDRHIASGER